MDCPFFFSFFHLLLPQFVITFHNLYIIFPHIIFIILNEICLYIYVLLKLRVSFLMYSKYEFYVSKYGLSIHNKVILMVTNFKLMWHWFGKSACDMGRLVNKQLPFVVSNFQCVSPSQNDSHGYVDEDQRETR